MKKACSKKLLPFAVLIVSLFSVLFLTRKYVAFKSPTNDPMYSFGLSKLLAQRTQFNNRDTESSRQQDKHDKKWIKQRINIFQETGENIKADCVPLRHMRSMYETKICIYNTSDDIYVSGSLNQSSTWEHDLLWGFGIQFQAHPDALFIDVGSHIGTFTMYATAFGHNVIAIDPLKSNLQLLAKSLRLAHRESNVTLLWNAVSNVYEDVWLRYEEKNIGSTHVVKKGGQGLKNSTSAAAYNVHTILLDDLVDNFQVKGKTVIMKIDIEGSEYLALLGATKLFREKTICYVSMELTFARERDTFQAIVEFMKSFGFELYDDPLLQKKITAIPHELSGHDGFFSKECV